MYVLATWFDNSDEYARTHCMPQDQQEDLNYSKVTISQTTERETTFSTDERVEYAQLTGEPWFNSRKLMTSSALLH